jgi:hypothetical protein
MIQKSDRALVFVAYSHHDELLKDELLKHLSTLVRATNAHCWHDRKIEPGQDWQQEIGQHLSEAQIILLLVSSDFISSDYCYGIEMNRAIERHSAGSACVIPVILRPCDWRGTALGNLQAMPRDGKPITLWANRDEAMNDVAQNIRKRIEALQNPTAQPSIAQPPAAPSSASATLGTHADICPSCKTARPTRCIRCKQCFVCLGIRPSIWNRVYGSRGPAEYHCGCGRSDDDESGEGESHIACS